jgi:hypothetical protein
MEQPNVVNVLLDAERNVRYEILAYRKLTQAEMLDCVTSYLRQKKRKRPKPGERVVIVTIIGFDS